MRPRYQQQMIWQFRRTLEAAVVIFIDENGDGPGCAFASDQKKNRESNPDEMARPVVDG
jgi:hypothetical protein